jgi:membrane protease YdiL (CAAX protease family)
MNPHQAVVPWSRKILISFVVVLCGLLVFVLGSNWYSIFPTNDSQAYRLVVAVIFLGAALFLRRGESTRQYSSVAYAFFVAMVGFFLTSQAVEIRASLFNALQVSANSDQYLAYSKVFESLLVVAAILILSALWGNDLGFLYIKKGRLGLGLFVGICLLTINTATGIVTGAVLGGAGDELLARLPWALLFSLANAMMEELWFRGLFMRRLIPLIGVVGTILVTSIIFTVMHAAASYMNPSEAILFQVIIFPMALLFSYLMHKTDSIWASVLYHAGSDVFLFYLMVL